MRQPVSANVYRLGLKELASLARDPVMLFLIVWTFTMAVYTVANGVKTEVRNAPIAIVDEDQSNLSRQITSAFLKPYFKPPETISAADIDRVLDTGRVSFVLDIPPKFEADLLAGRKPVLGLAVDATAMTLAGNGTGYIQAITADEIRRYLTPTGKTQTPVTLTIRARFNPNLESSWFSAIMQIINNITMLSMILAGAAVIREREHGTIEHLLAMPVRPVEIMLAKIWANGLVILIASIISLIFVVKGVIGVDIRGSLALFALGTAAFLFSMTGLGITLATIARSMPQFGLLAIPFFVVMNLLSGGIAPPEAMPDVLRRIMLAAPSTHFTSFAQSVLLRGAALDVVWRDLLVMLGLGGAFLSAALVRFRAAMSAAAS